MSQKGGAMTDDVRSQITLKLEGEKAIEGVSLAAFEGFVNHFLAALRYHHRVSTATPVRKAGRPFTVDELATSFRLVKFMTGSGIAVLEPPITSLDEESLVADADVPTLAWANLADLLRAVEANRTLDEAVVNELDSALKALGREGRFSLDLTSASLRTSQSFTAESLNRLRPAKVEPRVRPLTISGVLHAIDLEPDKVAVRTARGVDWICRYPAELESSVLTLIGQRVWARGSGYQPSARTGLLNVEEVHAVPEFEQTSLFTGAPLAVEELIKQQHVRGPQGLTTFVDPEWEDDEESALFLEALLGD